MVIQKGSGYRVFATKAKGAIHRLNDIPNQDAWKITYLDNVIIVAVADGLGSNRCKYSKYGSRIAVKVLSDMISEIYKNTACHNAEFFTALGKFRHDELPKNMEACWKERVKQHYVNEINTGDPNPGKEIYELYATTLLGIVLTKDFYFAIQIGDGNIISVYDDESVENVIEPDRQLGVETYCLSQTEAWTKFATNIVQPRENNSPILFLLSTDGLANSYANNQAFYQVGIDYLRWIKEKGFENVQEKIHNILRTTSEKGSGDDITLALAVNDNVINPEGGNV
jgi:serine/threonine protein phosphatase PrpC